MNSLNKTNIRDILQDENLSIEDKRKAFLFDSINLFINDNILLINEFRLGETHELDEIENLKAMSQQVLESKIEGKAFVNNSSLGFLEKPVSNLGFNFLKKIEFLFQYEQLWEQSESKHYLNKHGKFYLAQILHEFEIADEFILKHTEFKEIKKQKNMHIVKSSDFNLKVDQAITFVDDKTSEKLGAIITYVMPATYQNGNRIPNVWGFSFKLLNYYAYQ